MLDYTSEEAIDMEEDINDMSYTASPLTPGYTGNWAATSTHDVYMVDTPKEDEGDKDPPKR